MLKPILTALIGLLLALSSSAQTAQGEAVDTFAQAIRTRLDALVADELFRHAQLGFYVYDLSAQRPLYQWGHQQRMRPASTMKVLTGIIALDRLGADHRLTTGLYVGTAPTDSVLQGSVVLRGGFDPLLGRDDLRALVAQLKRNGVERIAGDLLLDGSMKDSLRWGWGWCWDDKEPPLTALSFRGKEGLSNALRRALESEGVRLTGSLREGTLPAQAQHVASRWHGIDQVLIPMMKRSDNLYAESLFYQLAATQRARYASHKDGQQVYERWVQALGIPSAHFQAADGSGLSLYNYLTPEVLVEALRYAAEREEIFNHLLPSLPIMGRDGTLSRRCRGTAAQDRVQAKTGTVDGVSSLAGYALAPNGHRLAFAILIQGLASTTAGRHWQDRVCIALTEGLGGKHIEPDTIAAPAPHEHEE